MGGVGIVMAEGLGGEVEAAGKGRDVSMELEKWGRGGNGDGPDEPEETFGGGVFLRFQLIDDEGLETF